MVAVSGQTITLDKEVSVQPGKNYQLLIRSNSTDIVSTFNVVNVSGLNVIVKESIPVQPDAVYAFGEVSKSAKPFRVLAITKTLSEMTRKIQCMEYYPELYVSDDGTVPSIDYTNHGASDIQAVGLVSDVYGANGIMYSRIGVTWQLPRDGKVSNVVVNYRNVKSDTWTYIGNYPASTNATTISDVLLGATYEVRVQAINELGQLTTGVTKSIAIPKMQAPEDVQNLHVLSRYNQTADKSVYYDLQVLFEPPANPANFDVAEVWYMLTAKSGKPITDQEWQYAGSSTSQVIIKALGPGETYRIKAVSVDRFGNRAETAQMVDVIVKPMDAVPDMPSDFGINFSRNATASWNEVLNADVDYYELRTDNNPGKDTNALLARVKGTSAVLTLTKRADTVYLYARSTLGKYSTAATYEYNVPQLAAPELVVKSQLGGFNLYFSTKPAQAYAIRCHVIGDERTDDFETTSTMLTYSNSAGIYRIRCSFVDVFGDGLVNEKQVVIKTQIDASLLDLESLGLNKVDERIKELDKKFNKNSEETTRRITNLASHTESRITELAGSIDLQVKKSIGEIDGGELVSRINLSQSGVYIAGKLIHITGATKFDDNVIVNKMIQANAVTADKLHVDSLSAVSGTIGLLRSKETGARVEIQDNLITGFDDDNNPRIKLGCW